MGNDVNRADILVASKILDHLFHAIGILIQLNHLRQRGACDTAEMNFIVL